MTSKLPVIPVDEIKKVASIVPTPFHLYDAKSIHEQCTSMKLAFSNLPKFNNYFAVKASPNPHLLSIIKQEGFGFDCSSLAELYLAEAVGARGDQIMLTSNETPLIEYKKAVELGAIINLDDASHLNFLNESVGLPELLCLRFNPGSVRKGNSIIGEPANSKFGMTKKQLIDTYVEARNRGVKRFGLHTMIISNCLDFDELIETASSTFALAVELKNINGLHLEFVNLGGGIGIPYHPDDKAIDIISLGEKISTLQKTLLAPNGLDKMAIYYECGRYITGPSGLLVTRVIHQKDTYKKFLGVDCTINSLMRPALYGSYHHITLIKDSSPNSNLPSRRNIFCENSEEKQEQKQALFDVVGSLCENNDKLATDRLLPLHTSIGDLLVFHDTGAHGHCMGFNYNGKLRSAEYLRIMTPESALPVISLQKIEVDSKTAFLKIREAETLEMLFQTIPWVGKLCP